MTKINTLITPENSALILIDHQPQMSFGGYQNASPKAAIARSFVHTGSCAHSLWRKRPENWNKRARFEDALGIGCACAF